MVYDKVAIFEQLSDAIDLEITHEQASTKAFAPDVMPILELTLTFSVVTQSFGLLQKLMSFARSTSQLLGVNDQVCKTML